MDFGLGVVGATSPLRYTYDETASLGNGVTPQGQLTSVTWQDGALRRYHYEDSRFPTLVTGVTDEAGVRHASYAYDQFARLVHSELVGGTDRMDFSYQGSGGPDVSSATVTDYTGPNGSATTRTYSFVDIGGTRFPAGVSTPCALCGSTQQASSYNAAGRLTKAVGHDGKVTFFAYDAKGRETERSLYGSAYVGAATRPALNLAESVTSTKWHATFYLPTQIAEPGKTTANTFNSKGMPTGTSWTATTDATGAAKFSAVKTGSTYATGWGYNASSLATTVVEKVDGVDAARWTMAYEALGNLTRITDVSGGNRIGRVTQYDAQGRVVTATTIDGDAVSLAYTPRGFVSSRTEDGKTNTYVQNVIGLTTEVRMPGGQVASFEYSAAHRLTAVRLNGALLAKAELRDGVPGNPILARAAELLERLLGATLRPAYAQAAAAGGTSFGSGVAPTMGLPGQSGTNASAILMGEDRPGNASPGGLLPRFNPATRRLAEALTAFCKCDPSGGYVQPKLTALALIHIVISGHTAPVYGNKSYFSEPVNQALVDEVVSRSPMPPRREGSEDVYYVADIGRFVGYKRGSGGVFELTRDVTLRVHADNCNNLLRVRNEVVTMHPGAPK